MPIVSNCVNFQMTIRLERKLTSNFWAQNCSVRWMTSNIWAKFCSLLALLKHSQAFCGRQFAKFEFDAMILFCCHLTMHKLARWHNSSIRLTWIYFKGFLYCLLYVESIAALTQLFFSPSRPQRPLTDPSHVFVTQTLRELVFVLP